MKKRTYRLLAALWILTFIATRVVYFLYGNQIVVDTYKYFATACIQADRTNQIFSSGMAYAYIGNLSGLLAFLGNRMELLGIYQLVLQIVWMILLFFGVGLIFGEIAQMLTGTILALSPWILESIFVISPENYFMLFFALILVGIGLFFSGAKESERQESFFQGAILLLIAFGTGIICTWNYLGWLLLLVAFYTILKSKSHWSKVFSFLVGVVLGIFMTLLKYTGMTGLSIEGQFAWWIEPLKALPKRCQDLSIQMAIWLVFAGVTGIFVAVIAESIKQRKLNNLHNTNAGTEKEATSEKKTPMEEKPVTYTVTADGRKVALLDNPLPLPKKHEKKKMDFKYNKLPKKTSGAVKEWQDNGVAFDDFDFTISENDDFDV